MQDRQPLTMEITTGKIAKPLKVVVYGPEGIGKSTFASHFPRPVFCDTEGSTHHMDVARTPSPESFTQIMEQAKYFWANPGSYQTFVLDTADWAEKLCMEQLCAKKQISGIEDLGYGKGYVYLAEEFGKLLNLLEDLTLKGMQVVVTAHAAMRKFEQPDELGAYDRWELKLQKKTAPLLKEWADMVLFANYKTLVVNVDNQGAAKGKNKAQGGKRVMYTSHHPCWDAKNRFGLPDEMPFDFSQIAHLITPMPHAKAQAPADSFPIAPAEPLPFEKPKAPEPPQTSANSGGRHVGESQYAAPDGTERPVPGIPSALQALMTQYGVQAQEIQYAVANKGYYPADTPIDRYDPNFVKGVLIGAWPQVFDMIKAQRDKVPFD